MVEIVFNNCNLNIDQILRIEFFWVFFLHKHHSCPLYKFCENASSLLLFSLLCFVTVLICKLLIKEVCILIYGWKWEEITYFVVFTGNSRLFAIFRFCSLFHKQEHVWQFTFIYSANSHLKLPQSALHGKVKTQDPNILEEPPHPMNQCTCLVTSGKEELPFNKKRPPKNRLRDLLWLVGDRGDRRVQKGKSKKGKKKKKHTRES